MRVIATANFKGGTAKTTTCCNLAAQLAREGRRVLVIDADAQHNSTDFFVSDADGYTLTDVLEGECEMVAADNIVRADRYDVDVLPADMGLLRLDLRAIMSQSNAPLKRMDDFIDALRADGEYEFVLFDCPPQFTAASVAALLNSDEVILPTKVDSFSRAGVIELVNQLGLVGLRLLRPMPRVRVLVTMADKTNLSKQGEALLRKSGFEVFQTVIRAGVAVGESSYTRQALYEYAPKSKPAQDYEALLREVLDDSTRVMSAADLSKQAERTNAVLLELRKQGFEFKGRTRELVAQIMHTSESKLARVGAIRKNLTQPMLDILLSLRLGLSHLLDHLVQLLAGQAAHRGAELLKELLLDLLRLLADSVCNAFIQASAVEHVPVRSSFDAEAYLAERAEEDDAFFEMLSAEADNFINNLGAVNSRQEGIQLLKENLGRYHHGWCTDWVDVNCSPKGVRLWDANGDSDADITRTWTDVYDMLCTIALNRAAINIGAEPEDEEDEDGPDVSRMDIADPEWMTGEPERDGRYLTIVKTPGALKPVEYKMDRTGGAWLFFGEPLPDGCGEVVGWWPLPKEE